jgi:hypothetical protein
MISNTVASLMLQLAAALAVEGESREGPEVDHVMLQLVRDANQIFESLHNHAEWTVELGVAIEDWTAAAQPFLKSS